VKAVGEARVRGRLTSEEDIRNQSNPEAEPSQIITVPGRTTALEDQRNQQDYLGQIDQTGPMLLVDGPSSHDDSSRC